MSVCFLYHRSLDVMLLEGWHGIFNVRNDLGTLRASFEGERVVCTGVDLEEVKKEKKKSPSPFLDKVKRSCFHNQQNTVTTELSRPLSKFCFPGNCYIISIKCYFPCWEWSFTSHLLWALIWLMNQIWDICIQVSIHTEGRETVLMPVQLLHLPSFLKPVLNWVNVSSRT